MRLLLSLLLLPYLLFADLVSPGSVSGSGLFKGVSSEVLPLGGGGGGSAFDADTISDLKIWQSAASEVYIDVGTTPATDGEAIYYWGTASTDSLPYIIQTTSSRRPLLDSDGMNGNPTVFFDGLTSGAVISLPSIPQPFTFIMVVEFFSPALSEYLFRSLGYEYSMYFRSSGTIRSSAGSNLTTSVGTSGATILVVTVNNTSSNVYFNGGTAVASGAIGANDIPSVTGYIGTQFDNDTASQKVEMNLSEWIIYGKLLSDSEINTVGNGLATQYGITWTDI